MALKAVAAPLGSPVGGSGTANTIPRWTGASTLGDSIIIQGSTANAIGIGTTPNTWNSAIRAFDLRTNSLWNFNSGSDSVAYWTVNAYTDTAGNVVYKNSAAASQYTQIGGAHVWSRAASGVAGAGCSFLESARIDLLGNLLMAGNGTAANPIIANSTGVSGMYFPSATTVAIAANGSIAATFSKVAGAGVALGGTTGLVFDASGNQQGIKLRATPDSTDTQTLDCYQDGGASAGGLSWTPTLSAAATWGGTAPTVTNARYTRIGNLVFCTVTLDATGAVAFSSTYGSSTISSPAGLSATASTTVQSNRAGVSANGAQGGSTVYVPTYASNTTVINLTWFFAV